MTNDTFPFWQERLIHLYVSLERRRISALSRLDDGLLIVVAVVGVIMALAVLGWIIHIAAAILKIAVLAAVFGLVFRVVTARRGSR